MEQSHSNFTDLPYLYSLGIRRMKMFAAWVACLVVGLTAMAGEHVLEFKGKDGPGKGKTIVLISGDEEYRSEEAMPLLAKILFILIICLRLFA